MSSSKAPSATANFRTPDCVTRDEIIPILQNQWKFYVGGAVEGHDANNKSLLAKFDNRYDRQKGASAQMATGTATALSCLDGNANVKGLSKVLEARKKVSEYDWTHSASGYKNADKILFQASLLAKYPEEKQVYVKEDSKYPGMYFDTIGGRDTVVGMKDEHWEERALECGIRESRAYTNQSTARVEISENQGSGSNKTIEGVQSVNDGNRQKVRVVANQPSSGSQQTLESVWDADPDWYKSK